MRSSDRSVVMRFGCAGLLAGTALITPAIAADPTKQDIANSVFECAVMMRYAEELNEPFQFNSRVLFLEFEEYERNHGVSKQAAIDFAKEQFETLTAGMTEGRAEDFIIDTALDCESIFIEREAKRIAKEQGEASEGREITVADLRAHFATNRNPRVIADYIIDRHPGGKALMGDPIPEGEYLAELVVQIGVSGIKALSDGALVAMADRPYWQYNPPASRLVIEEYRRRLRARKYSEREAKAWAKRVEDERRRDMQQTASRMAERWGGSMKCTNVAPQGVEGKSYTSCRLLDRFGQ